MSTKTYLDFTGLQLYNSLLQQYIDTQIDGFVKILYDTKANWDKQTTLVSQANTFYIYSDAYQDSQGNDVPGVKIGDGNAYVVDLPFIGKLYDEHLADTVKHITAAERAAWNNKVRCYLDTNNAENLVLTTN